MIEFGGHYGEVVRLDLSATWLRTFNDNTVMIPSAEFLTGAVSNSNSGALDEMVVVTLDLLAAPHHRRQGGGGRGCPRIALLFLKTGGGDGLTAP